MRRAKTWWPLFAMTMLGLAGCWHTSRNSEINPERPEDYKLPPAGMYTKPADYPKEYMNQFPQRKGDNVDTLPPASPGPQRSGGMGGRPM